jgi:hypothetical protein
MYPISNNSNNRRAGIQAAIGKFSVAVAGLALATISLNPDRANAATFTVPGTANLYLSGLPSGMTSTFGDTTFNASPVQVSGVPITAGTILNFSATGGVNNDPAAALQAPDGNAGGIVSHADENERPGFAENGIASFTAPINSLIGVFLGSSSPTTSAAPTALDFSTSASRAYSSLSPLLKQVFYIGDGLTGTGTGARQSIVVPVGATRLFLGTADGIEWNNNAGQFTVDVTAIPGVLSASNVVAAPEPFTLVGTLVGSAAALRLRKRLKATNDL